MTPAILVLAAGAGTRMRSDTQVLHRLGGRSVLSHALRGGRGRPAASCGGTRKGPRTHRPGGRRVGRDELGRAVEVAIQDQQLGTGHAALCGLSALPADFDGVVVVTSGDIPLLDAGTLAELVATHRREPAAVTVLTTTVPDSTGYGRILRTQDGEVIAIVEGRPTPPAAAGDPRINAGIYAFDIAALRSALGRLSSDNAQHELYLTDVISIVAPTGRSYATKHVEDSALVAGVNDRVQLAELAAELNRRVVATHQRAGGPWSTPPAPGSM